MKKFITFCDGYGIPARLVSAVIKQFGGWSSFKESAPDINRHGILGGYSGWIYHSELYRFAMKNRKTIVALLEERASQLGSEVVEMIAGFGLFRNDRMDNEDRKQLYRFLGGGQFESGRIADLMAWFACEEVCHAYENWQE